MEIFSLIDLQRRLSEKGGSHDPFFHTGFVCSNVDLQALDDVVLECLVALAEIASCELSSCAITLANKTLSTDLRHYGELVGVQSALDNGTGDLMPKFRTPFPKDFVDEFTNYVRTFKNVCNAKFEQAIREVIRATKNPKVTACADYCLVFDRNSKRYRELGPGQTLSELGDPDYRRNCITSGFSQETLELPFETYLEVLAECPIFAEHAAVVEFEKLRLSVNEQNADARASAKERLNTYRVKIDEAELQVMNSLDQITRIRIRNNALRPGEIERRTSNAIVSRFGLCSVDDIKVRLCLDVFNPKLVHVSEIDDQLYEVFIRERSRLEILLDFETRFPQFGLLKFPDLGENKIAMRVSWRMGLFDITGYKVLCSDEVTTS